MFYEWVVSNKELLKVLYVLVLTFICSIIVLKTDRLFKLSDHQGLRYFRNAFFLYGSAFIFRYILGSRALTNASENYFLWIGFIFKFLLITAGLTLLYSLIWKKVEKEKQYHSFFNLNMLAIYIFSALMVFLDGILKSSLFLYLSQILLFLILVVISYLNFNKQGEKYPFLKYYFLTMLIGLLTWVLNFCLLVFLEWNLLGQMIAYGLNLIFFLLFLYGVTKMGTRKNG